MKARAITALLLAAAVGVLLSQVALADSGPVEFGAPAATAAEPAAVPAPALAPVAARRVRGAVARARAKARPPAFLAVHVRRPLSLRGAPRGRALARVGATTRFGRPTVFGVVKRRGPWLGVTSPALPNGRLGWIRRGAGVRVSRIRVSLHADLSARTLELRRDGRLLRRLRVAVGRPGSPTPRGRFAVTEKLDGTDFGPYYGCCVLPISATQPHTPPGWRGGNRMAIHGTNAPKAIGKAASAGCLRAPDRDLRVLMRVAPAGTPVFIHG